MSNTANVSLEVRTAAAELSARQQRPFRLVAYGGLFLFLGSTCSGVALSPVFWAFHRAFILEGGKHEDGYGFLFFLIVALYVVGTVATVAVGLAQVLAHDAKVLEATVLHTESIERT